MSNADEAFKLLKESKIFSQLCDELLREVASKMQVTEAADGHTFFYEGEDIHSVLIIESGSVKRTKLVANEEGDVQEMNATRKSMGSHNRLESLNLNSIVIDTLEGRGEVLGILHNFETPSVAYATVSASGPVRAWLIEGTALREVVSSKPEFSIQFIGTLTKMVREGNKLLRATMKKSLTENGAQKIEFTFKVLCYDATSWVQDGFGPALKSFNEANEDNDGIKLVMDFTSERLNEKSASYAVGYDAVCLFVNDTANSSVLQTLSSVGVKMVAMRCAGFDRVDTTAAKAFGLTVARVPAYSPYAVAEMAVALLMSVNRKIHKASNRVKMANFTLDSALLGSDIHGKTVGVMGTGKIGQILCKIMLGFGCKLLCYDVYESEDVKKAGGTYVSKDEIMAQSDILFLMMPLLPPTRHTINCETVEKLKKGVILINTSRGGLIDTKALLKGLREEIISGVGVDVYENEQEYFFQDWSARNIPDADLVALMGNNNVVMTAHQAFFTQEAVDKIVDTTISNFHDFYFQKLKSFDHPNSCIPKPK